MLEDFKGSASSDASHPKVDFWLIFLLTLFQVFSFSLASDVIRYMFRTLFFQNQNLIWQYEFNDMLLHTWTHISISNCSLIPYYRQNFKDINPFWFNILLRQRFYIPCGTNSQYRICCGLAPSNIRIQISSTTCSTTTRLGKFTTHRCCPRFGKIWILRDLRKMVSTQYSAYQDIINNDNASLQHKVAGYWSIVWKLKLLPNIKNFLWTVYHKCLMIRLHLKNRGLRCPAVCDVCTEKDEDWTNVFLGCTKSIACRQGIGLCNTILHVLHSATSCAANMFAILKIVYVKQKKIFGVTFWSLWTHWNNKVWNNVKITKTSVSELDPC